MFISLGTGSNEVKQDSFPIPIENIIAVFFGEYSLILSHIVAWTNVSLSEPEGDEIFLFVCGREWAGKTKVEKKNTTKEMWSLYFAIIKLPIKWRQEILELSQHSDRVVLLIQMKSIG